MTANGGRDEPAPVRRLYGRSSGKTLRAGQQRLLAETLPLFSIAPEALAAERGFAPPARELWLEIDDALSDSQRKTVFTRLQSGLERSEERGAGGGNDRGSGETHGGHGMHQHGGGMSRL